MELILLNDGVYSLVSVTKAMIDGVQLLSDANCFDLCDILRLTPLNWKFCNNDENIMSFSVFVNKTA